MIGEWLWSISAPRYFAGVVHRMFFQLSFTSSSRIVFLLFCLIITSALFSTFTVIFHFMNHSSRLCLADGSLFPIILGFLEVVIIPVSSAYNIRSVSFVLGISACV